MGTRPSRGVPIPDVTPLRISDSNGGVGTFGEFALEPAQRGGSNVPVQCMFLAKTFKKVKISVFSVFSV